MKTNSYIAFLKKESMREVEVRARAIRRTKKIPFMKFVSWLQNVAYITLLLAVPTLYIWGAKDYIWPVTLTSLLLISATSLVWNFVLKMARKL